MTKMKPLSQRDIRDLNNLRVQRGLRLPDLAKELGVAERTLSRYFEGILPRNNDKGRKVYAKIRELLKEFRATAPKEAPKPKEREKRVTVSGVFINNSLVIEIHDFLKREKIDLTEFASRLDISEGHMLSVMNQESKASIRLRDAIVALVAKKPELPQTIEEAMQLSDAAAEKLSTTDVVEKVTLTGLDGKSLGLYNLTHITAVPHPSLIEKEVYTHEFRLRSDFVVKVELPTNLTLEEAGRISAFIQLIVLD